MKSFYPDLVRNHIGYASNCKVNYDSPVKLSQLTDYMADFKMSILSQALQYVSVITLGIKVIKNNQKCFKKTEAIRFLPNAGF